MNIANERNNMAEKLVLVSAIEELNKGDTFEDQDWPLHVTIVPWFSVQEQFEPGMVRSLANHMHHVRPQTVIGDQNELFGERKTVKVRTLRHIGQLATLHTNILDVLNRIGGEVDSPYIRDLYRPHVTYQHGVSINEGQEVTLSRMQLIRGDESGPRRVENVFSFIKGMAE